MSAFGWLRADWRSQRPWVDAGWNLGAAAAAGLAFVPGVPPALAAGVGVASLGVAATKLGTSTARAVTTSQDELREAMRPAIAAQVGQELAKLDPAEQRAFADTLRELAADPHTEFMEPSAGQAAAAQIGEQYMLQQAGQERLELARDAASGALTPTASTEVTADPPRVPEPAPAPDTPGGATGSEPAAPAQPAPEGEPGPPLQPGVEGEPDPVVESEPQDTQPEPEPPADALPEPEPEPGPEPESVGQPRPLPEPEPDPGPDPQPQNELPTQGHPEPLPEPAPAPESEPAPAPAPEPAPEPPPEPEPEPG